MLRPSYTSQFERDRKRLGKQKKDLTKLRQVMEDLIAERPLSPQLKDHPLVGNWKGYRECHIGPDWLLIYKRTETEIVFVRTGDHSELFKR